jgi:peroxiredoxin
MEQLLNGMINTEFRAADLQIRDSLHSHAHLAPDFSLPAAGGQHIRLSDFRGCRVMLVFGVTWGRLCRAQLPALTRLSREHDVIVLAVFCGEPLHIVADFAAGHALDFPALSDGSGEVKRRYGVTCLPTTFIIDEQGRMVHMHRGEMDDGALAPTDRLID